MIANGTPPARPQERRRPSGGFLAFLAVMVLPTVIALAIVGGAWAVADDVYAAEAADDPAQATGAPAVAPWKTTLVGICPIH